MNSSRPNGCVVHIASITNSVQFSLLLVCNGLDKALLLEISHICIFYVMYTCADGVKLILHLNRSWLQLILPYNSPAVQMNHAEYAAVRRKPFVFYTVPGSRLRDNLMHQEFFAQCFNTEVRIKTKWGKNKRYPEKSP